MLAGIDEAGRGCVIGPLVIAAVYSNDSLTSLNLKDSKLLSPSKRNFLFKEIPKHAKFKLVKITAIKLNELMAKMSLNVIEKNYMVQLANEILNEGENIENIIIDCPDVNTIRFSKEFRDDLIKTKTKVTAEHKADYNYPIVSAASIIAKVTRDAEIEKIKKKVGFNFNSGYSSDVITRKYLEENYDNPILDPYIRKRWSTYQRLLKKAKQDTLF